MKRLRVGVMTSHPIQYQAPWFRALAQYVDLHVFFAHRATPADQANAGFGVEFEWDSDLTSGYEHSFLSNVARSPGTGSYSGCDTPDILDYITAGSFDAFIVGGWYLKSYVQAIRACWRSNIPLLLRGDSQLLGRRSLVTRAMKQIVLRALFARVQGFLSVGQRFSEFLSHYGVGPERIFPTPHCVDNNHFHRASTQTLREQAELRSEMNIKRGGHVLLFAGKLIERKRPLDLISAAQRLVERKLSVHVVIAGDGPMRDQVEAEAREKMVPLRTAGFINQSKMPVFYGLSDVLVLPSDASETWGLVVNEAMACGKPAVVSEEVGCSPDMIREGLTGYTFPLGDCEALGDRLERVLSWPATGAHKVAIQDAVARHSIEETVNGVRDALAYVCP